MLMGQSLELIAKHPLTARRPIGEPGGQWLAVMLTLTQHGNEWRDTDTGCSENMLLTGVLPNERPVDTESLDRITRLEIIQSLLELAATDPGRDSNTFFKRS